VTRSTARGPQTVRDVVSGNPEVVSLVVPAADHDVAMRIAGAEMIDRDPVGLRAEILFHFRIRSRINGFKPDSPAQLAVQSSRQRLLIDPA
jgi:hypothetical protein